MAISVITFDLDNTLWDVKPTLIKAERKQQDWLQRHRPGTVEAYDDEALWEFRKAVWQRHPQLSHDVSAMRIQMLYELQLAAGYSDAAARSGAEQAFAVFLTERHKVVLYEQALDVVQGLAGRYTLGALTNGNADIFKTDAADYFDFAFLAQDIGTSKPHPDMFSAALRHSDVEPAQVIHVGDDPEHDVRGARQMGMHTVWVNYAGKDWPGGPRADREIRHLRQLPAAICAIEKTA